MTLNKEDGIISVRSLELLALWIYLGQVIFGDLGPTESMTTAIEFVQ